MPLAHRLHPPPPSRTRGGRFWYSDAYSGIGNLGALIANAAGGCHVPCSHAAPPLLPPPPAIAVTWGGLNKTIGLAMLLLIAPIFAGERARVPCPFSITPNRSQVPVPTFNT
jgi:hypothetical protein